MQVRSISEPFASRTLSRRFVEAYKSADPGDGEFDIILHNCSDFIVSLAKPLGLELTEDERKKVTSYVVQQLFQDGMHVDEIRSRSLALPLETRNLRHDPSDKELVTALVETRMVKF